jgi:hypothetical protein
MKVAVVDRSEMERWCAAQRVKAPARESGTGSAIGGLWCCLAVDSFVDVAFAMASFAAPVVAPTCCVAAMQYLVQSGSFANRADPHCGPCLLSLLSHNSCPFILLAWCHLNAFLPNVFESVVMASN